MMATVQSSDRTLSHVDHAIAGAASGTLTRLFFQPLDVIKIRFQLQIEPISRNCRESKYKSICQTFLTICREEGIKSLWKGHMPAQLLSVVFSTTQFVMYETISNILRENQNIPRQNNSVVNFVAGGLAGCCATLLCQPFDVIRTRLVGQGEPKIYRGLLDASLKMYVHEGPLAFYRGILPTLLQIAPYNGFTFAFYKAFSTIWKQISESNTKYVGLSESIICGFMSGSCSKAAVYPLDVFKKRLQIQGFRHGRVMFGSFRDYSSMIHCFASIAKEEGIKGMYKGLTPSLLKAAITTASHFAIYEQSCRLISSLRKTVN